MVNGVTHQSKENGSPPHHELNGFVKQHDSDRTPSGSGSSLFPLLVLVKKQQITS